MPEISNHYPGVSGRKIFKKCVDSILSQSFTDWELLLVDDGSTDKSSEICRTYAEQDARIRYHQKENGGVSSARNAGVALAEGRYITFCGQRRFRSGGSSGNTVSSGGKNMMPKIVSAADTISMKEGRCRI